MKKIYILTLLLALGLNAETNNPSELEDRGCCPTNQLAATLFRVDAIQQSELAIGAFGLAFSAAIRAHGSSASVAAVLSTLTTPFKITVVEGPTSIVATDAASLTSLIQAISTGTTFDASLIGNFSLVNYANNGGRRTVQLNGLQYPVVSLSVGGSLLLPALDQWTVAQQKVGGPFMVQALIATSLASIPLG